MSTNRLLTQAWTATILLSLCFTLPAQGVEDCADIPQARIIEKIPEAEIEGSTCIDDPGVDVVNLQSYAEQGSKSCPLAGVSYPAHDVIYKVKLNKGNEVAFLLTPEAKDATKPDLVLTLITACDDGLSCVSSSPDFIGSGKEEIPAAQYKEGVYYLVVDSFYETDDDSCGKYRLKITGVNPTPDLSLEIKTKSKRAVAGQEFVYTLTISNTGTGRAEGVKLMLTLAPNVTAKGTKKSIVEWTNISVDPRVGDKPGTWTTDLTAVVSQHLEGKIIASAQAELSGYPLAQDSLTTAVDHKHDLSVQLSASNGAVAGDPRTYTLTLRNDGPSDATDVTATVTLDADEDLESYDGKVVDGQLVYDDLDLEADGPAQTRTFVVRIKSSATSSISHRATIDTETGTDPDRGDNEAHLDTLVSRETNLSIDSVSASRLNVEQAGSIAAGADFTYAIGVANDGPSDSSGGTVTLKLPWYLEFHGSASGCEPTPGPSPEDDFLVTCDILRTIPAHDRSVVEFSLGTSSALGMQSFHREAFVAANEKDPLNNNSRGFDTEIVIEADLQFVDGKLDATPSVCGGDILYTMKVANHGPSDSPGGTVTDELEGLSFVASPDCAVGSDNRTVTCPVDSLAVGAPPVDIQFRALPMAPGVVRNRVSVQGEHDPTADKSDVVKTTVSPGTDLELTLSPLEDPVKPGQPFLYRVAVTNHGPAKVEGVKAEVTLWQGLPQGVKIDPDCTVCESSCTVNLGDVEAHDTQEAMICATAPAETGPFKATAKLSDSSCNPAGDSLAETTTTVAEDEDADLSLTMTANKPVVSEGDLLTYTIKVVNHGFGPAEDVGVLIDLDDGLTFDSGEHCALSENPPGVLCAASDATLVAKVGSTDGSLLTTHAMFSPEPQNDLNKANNQVDVSTQQAAPLIVPFVDAAHPTTTFTLKNPSEQLLSLEYSVFLPGRSAEPIPLDLSPKAMATVDVLTPAPLVEDEELSFGHVEIALVSGPEPPTGDFTLFDAARGAVSGERLISRDTDLCGSWSVRFYNDWPAGSSTDLLFFVPDNPGDVVARGTVFSETGAFVKDIEVPLAQESYRYPVQVPAGAGSIEWTFSNGFVGSVTAIHQRREGDDVAIPGFCRGSENIPAESLILPWFQTNGAINAYVAVRNETDSGVQLKVTFPGRDEPSFYPLAAHAVRTANLRGLLGPVEGALKIEAFKSADEKEPIAALSGDFIRIGPDGLAGSALVEKPTGLCTKWDVRFKPGSSFLFYLDKTGTPDEIAPPKGKVYGETGTPRDEEVSAGSSAQSFLVLASDLGLSDGGSVEWNLGVPGYVAMLLPSNGGGLALIPGAPADCLEEEGTPEEPPH